jgi:hypothetical protein
MISEPVVRDVGLFEAQQRTLADPALAQVARYKLQIRDGLGFVFLAATILFFAWIAGKP